MPLILKIEKKLIVAINASRARSGGARSHLKGILNGFDPSAHKIDLVHIWSYKELLADLPNFNWLKKHECKYSNSSIVLQLYWERFKLCSEIHSNNCDILLNVDAGSVCRFSPSVTMSRDMLPFERVEMQRYGLSRSRLRLELLKIVQSSSLRFADGAIFLSNYAADKIQQAAGTLRNFRIIHHGVSDRFRIVDREYRNSNLIRLLYISNTDWYKHQWNVVKAVEICRKNGLNVTLSLVGGGNGRPYHKLLKQIQESDPNGNYINLISFVQNDLLPQFLSQADIFIFASSCENLPNTLIEAMAAGLPIACSNRGPMPEVLGDAGLYFDPEDSESIALSIKTIAINPELANWIASEARKRSQAYSWNKCAKETWQYVREIWYSSQVATCISKK
jgi:glycosyltransferase involved in cell wall biosynthesis